MWPVGKKLGDNNSSFASTLSGIPGILTYDCSALKYSPPSSSFVLAFRLFTLIKSPFLSYDFECYDAGNAISVHSAALSRPDDISSGFGLDKFSTVSNKIHTQVFFMLWSKLTNTEHN